MNTQNANRLLMPWRSAALHTARLPAAAVRAAARLGVAFEGELGAVLRRTRGALLDCKFATVNQLFGGAKVAGPNWSGVRSRFMDMVAAIASAKSREAVAGGHWVGTVSGAGHQGGTAGVGDLVNEARA